MMLDDLRTRSIVFGTTIFAATLVFGSVFASLLSGAASEHRCTRWQGIDPSRRFFTLQEGVRLQGQEIKYTKPAKFGNNAGRIAGLDLVENDKFFIIVDWDATPETGAPGLRWYDKDFYEEHLAPR